MCRRHLDAPLTHISSHGGHVDLITPMHSLTVPDFCAIVRQSTRTIAILYDSVLKRTNVSIVKITQKFRSTRIIAVLYDSVLCTVRLCPYVTGMSV
jgi:hypothetical protein